MSTITPQILLRAYAAGIFPMAESAEDNALYWVEPDERGIIPLDGLKISHSLRKSVRRRLFEVKIDHDFPAVIAECAAKSPGRNSTWINNRIKSLYTQLHRMGCCHSVECWQDGRLVGGLYGVRIGAVFFGESMFSRVTDASKVALVHLVARLNYGGFRLLDAQFVNPHLERLGAIQMPRARIPPGDGAAAGDGCRFLRLRQGWRSRGGAGLGRAAQGGLTAAASPAMGSARPQPHQQPQYLQGTEQYSRHDERRPRVAAEEKGSKGNGRRERCSVFRFFFLVDLLLEGGEVRQHLDHGGRCVGVAAAGEPDIVDGVLQRR